jgi:21S rRNA (GM2251-2'-O)-methyltransferase
VVVDNDDDWQDSGASYQDDEWQPSSSPRSRYGSGGGGSSRYNSRDNDPRDQRELYPARPNPRDLLFGEVLYGVSPVLAALKHQRRTIHALYIQQSIDFSKRKDASSIKEAIQRAKELGAAVHETSKHDLNLLSNDRPHQGLVLDVSPLTWKPMDVFPTAAAAAAATAGRQPVWLALDEVVDPQNLGAVIRSAYCLGATGVLACSKNCAPLSAVVSKASAGVLEVIELHSCNSLPRTLLDAREKGWLVLGAAAGQSSKSCRDVAVAQPTVLVVGSEGFGLRTNVRRACDQLVRVDMGISRRDSVVDSLNVSVATGILLHQLLGAAGGAAVVDDGGEDPASGDDEAEGEELE